MEFIVEVVVDGIKVICRCFFWMLILVLVLFLRFMEGWLLVDEVDFLINNLEVEILLLML